MNKERDVLALLERSGEDKREINMGLLSEGRRIGERLGRALCVLAVDELPDDKSTLEAFGASKAIVLKGKYLHEYQCDAFSWAIGAFLKEFTPRLCLLAHSDMGRELAPRIAYQLGSAAVMDCVDVRVDDGVITYVKSVYEDQFEQQVAFSSGLLEVATIRPEVLNKKAIPEPRLLAVEEIPIEVPAERIRTKPLGITAPAYDTMDIVHAKRVVGAGMGAVDADLQTLVQELANLLEGSLGTTRPVVDEGEVPKERMIGQTGKQVAPELYLALGISGSPHHVAGIQESKRILSVNRDPRAPMHHYSDVGFVGDLKGVLPKLINRIRIWKEASSNEEL